MPTAKKTPATKKVPEKKPGTGLAKWEERLAKYADEATSTEKNSGTGIKSFSLKAGVLSLNDEPFRNNEMAVIVLDHVLLNRYDESEYDPDVKTPPTCFALGRTDEEMAPHPSVVAAGTAQHPTCAGCPMNEWGTAAKGRGKACGNKRRLLVIPAGSFDRNGDFTMIDDIEHFKTAEAAFLLPPVTSCPGWALYVKQLKSALRRPPLAVVTRVKVVPDAKSQFKVEFEAIEELDDAELVEVLMDRHDASAELIMQPYNMEFDSDQQKGSKGRNAPAKKPGKKQAGKPVQRKPNGRKY